MHCSIDLQPPHHFNDLPSYTHLTACDDTFNAELGLKYMNPPAPIQYTQTQPHHGIKRSAPADEIESSANISTEFKKLRLNSTLASNNSNLTRRSVDGDNVSRISQTSAASSPLPLSSEPVSSSTDRHSAPVLSHSYSDDSMTVDDTPDRIYISDLDREIAEIEADETLFNTAKGSFFLPDVEKNISKIPLNVLRQNFDAAVGAAPSSSRAANEQALVLYRDPTSISVPEEEDAVRKTIIVARRNAREKMKEDHELRVNAAMDSSDDMDAEHDDDRMELE